MQSFQQYFVVRVMEAETAIENKKALLSDKMVCDAKRLRALNNLELISQSGHV